MASSNETIRTAQLLMKWSCRTPFMFFVMATSHNFISHLTTLPPYTSSIYVVVNEVGSCWLFWLRITKQLLIKNRTSRFEFETERAGLRRLGILPKLPFVWDVHSAPHAFWPIGLLREMPRLPQHLIRTGNSNDELLAYGSLSFILFLFLLINENRLTRELSCLKTRVIGQMRCVVMHSSQNSEAGQPLKNLNFLLALD